MLLNLICSVVIFEISLKDSMDVKESPGSDSRNSTPEPRAIFKDKKEALEAFKELLREKVSLTDFSFTNYQSKE